MSLHNSLKSTLAKAIKFKKRTAFAMSQSHRRHWMFFMQFVSMQKKDRIEVCNRYKLSAAERKEVDEFYLANYGKKISYRWHEFFAGGNGKFNKEYVPLSIYLAEFETFMNPYKGYVRALENKQILPMIAKTIGVKTARSLFIAGGGKILNENYDVISREELIAQLANIGEVFIKPTVDSSGGAHCYCCDIADGVDTLSNKKIEDILSDVGENFVVQNVLKNHESIAKIYGQCADTFRVVTYRWKEEICTAPAVLRLGRNGSRVDNACSGGMYVAVAENGKLGEMACTDSSERIFVHPDSKIVFKDYSIMPITGVLEAAKKMHRALPMLGVVNWDFMLDENGDAVLIEANIMNGGIDMIERGCGVSLFGDKTAEVLRWIRLMKSTPARKREKYYFGYGV